MAIHAVIFDLFGMLIRVGDLEKRRRWERDAGVAEGALQRELVRSARFREAIAGRAPEAELWRDVAQTLGIDAREWRALAVAFYSSCRPNAELWWSSCARCDRPTGRRSSATRRRTRGGWC